MNAEVLHKALGLTEEPLGMHYTNKKPESASMPPQCAAVAEQLATSGQVDMAGIRKNFSCILKHIRVARQKKIAACFAADHYGCVGGSFFLGFHRPQIEFTARFISMGIPGTPVHGERYLNSVERAQEFMQATDVGLAPARYCVFKPLSHFGPDEKPLFVNFFCRFEVFSGLYTLANFVGQGLEAVRIPFGSGCANLIAWPRVFAAKGTECAVAGGMDPSCRPYCQTDEQTFTVPYAMYEKFLAQWENSFLLTETWETQKKKIAKSQSVWEN